MPETKDMYGLPPGIITDVNGLPTLEPLWWAIDEPGMDDLYAKAGGDGGSLQPMIDRLKVYPVNINNKGATLFLAQYILGQDGTTTFNFMDGFPIDVLEILVLIGEYSSLTANVDVVPGAGKPVPPMPTKIFSWPETDHILLNKMYSSQTDGAAGLTTKLFADSLGAEKPKTHWWFGATYAAGQADQRKFPLPGEFVGLGVRLFVDKIWGQQLSNPFIFSGNWADTIFYSSAVVKSVNAPTDDQPYPTYEVQWRGQTVTAVPTDFAVFAVGDRVTVLKSCDATKTEQRYDDEDAKDTASSNFNDLTWTLVPVSFFSDENGIGI